jgi:hypothetical protein
METSSNVWMQVSKGYTNSSKIITSRENIDTPKWLEILNGRSLVFKTKKCRASNITVCLYHVENAEWDTGCW